MGKVSLTVPKPQDWFAKAKPEDETGRYAWPRDSEWRIETSADVKDTNNGYAAVLKRNGSVSSVNYTKVAKHICGTTGESTEW